VLNDGALVDAPRRVLFFDSEHGLDGRTVAVLVLYGLFLSFLILYDVGG